MTTRPRAILFDWDNTLVDSWGCIHACYNQTFRAFGHREWSLQETKTNVAKSLRDSFPTLFGERWPEARDVFYQTFEDVHLSYLQPLPGVVELLTLLHGEGIFLGVVSNKKGHFLRKEAEVLGWTGWFGALVGAQDAEADKPAPAPVHLALQNAPTVAGGEVWFVGDSPIDMQCAHNTGCVPVLLRGEPPHLGEFDLHPPAYCFEGCAAMGTLVRELSVPISLV